MDNISERDAAVDYMRQLQKAHLVYEVDVARDRATLINWAKANRGKLAPYLAANSGGQALDQAEDLFTAYLATLEGSEAKAPFEDINAHAILTQLIGEVEQFLRTMPKNYTSPVVGVTPAGALEALSIRVPFTDQKIVLVSAQLFNFANLISKIVASVVEVTIDARGTQFAYEPATVLARAESKPEIGARLATLLGSFAVTNRYLMATPHVLGSPHSLTRIYLLKAMEWFVVGHEYGHNLAGHKIDQVAAFGSGDEHLEQVEYLQRQELEADGFGLLIAAGVGQRFMNPFAESGAGAVIILSGLEMVYRARQILRCGSEDLPKGGTHPPVELRRQAFDLASRDLFPEHLKPLGGMRADFAAIMDGLWSQVRGFFYDLHKEGVRPIYDQFPKIEPSSR